MESKKFWVFSADGFVCEITQKDHRSFKQFGNYFKTREEAEACRDFIQSALYQWKSNG